MTSVGSATKAMGIRVTRRDRGAAAIEFALVAPLFVTLLLGVSDLAPATMAKFKAANATQSAADLITQFSEMQTSDMVNVFAGAATVMAPFSGSNLTLRITSVASDGKGNAFVDWSCGQGSLPATAGKSAVTSTPSGGPPLDSLLLMSTPTDGSSNQNGADTSFIMVESSYTYDAPAKFLLRTTQTMTNVAYMLPRQSSYVGFPWDGDPNDAPTAPSSVTKKTNITLDNGVRCKYAY